MHFASNISEEDVSWSLPCPLGSQHRVESRALHSPAHLCRMKDNVEGIKHSLRTYHVVYVGFSTIRCVTKVPHSSLHLLEQKGEYFQGGTLRGLDYSGQLGGTEKVGCASFCVVGAVFRSGQTKGVLGAGRLEGMLTRRTRVFYGSGFVAGGPGTTFRGQYDNFE